MSYSAWCVFCDFWARAATLEEARQVQDDHYERCHPTDRIPTRAEIMAQRPPPKTPRKGVRKEMTMAATAEAATETKAAVELDAAGLDPEPARGQLALPGMDSVYNDWIELSFTGTVRLNKSDPEDCALIRRLKLGTETAVDVDAVVVHRAQSARFDDEGNREVTLGTKVKVTGLRRPPF